MHREGSESDRRGRKGLDRSDRFRWNPKWSVGFREVFGGSKGHEEYECKGAFPRVRMVLRR